MYTVYLDICLTCPVLIRTYLLIHSCVTGRQVKASWFLKHFQGSRHCLDNAIITKTYTNTCPQSKTFPNQLYLPQVVGTAAQKWRHLMSNDASHCICLKLLEQCRTIVNVLKSRMWGHQCGNHRFGEGYGAVNHVRRGPQHGKLR